MTQTGRTHVLYGEQADLVRFDDGRRYRCVAANPRHLIDVFGLADAEALLGRADSDLQPPPLAQASASDGKRRRQTAGEYRVRIRWGETGCGNIADADAQVISAKMPA